MFVILFSAEDHEERPASENNTHSSDDHSITPPIEGDGEESQVEREEEPQIQEGDEN